MSRIGKMPIELPDKVTITVDDDNLVTVKGPKGELSQQIHKDIKVVVEDGQIKLERPSNSKPHRSLHGLSRSLINNMVEGVVNGFKKKLEINGVGYRAQKQGKTLVLNVGYSHPVEIEEEDGIEFEVPAANQVIVSGIDKQRVGAVAAVIRGTRPPEPYKGKGIKFVGEQLRRKSGKTAGK